MASEECTYSGSLGVEPPVGSRGILISDVETEKINENKSQMEKVGAGAK